MGSPKFDIWPSVSDMMSALMAIFLFIAVLFMTRVEAKQEEVLDLVEQIEKNNNELAEEIIDSFKDKEKELGAVVLPSGIIRFNNPDLLFERGSTKIKKQFKNVLKKFFPQYLNVIINKNRNIVKAILITGHTSSEWGNSNKNKIPLNKRYLKNMSLSSRRAFAILSYCFSLDEVSKEKKWLIKVMRSEGVAFADPVIIDGKEDVNLSKRVEFSVLQNSDSQLKTIIDKTKQNSFKNAIKKVSGQ